MQRRNFLRLAAATTAVPFSHLRTARAVEEAPFQTHQWRRHEKNPVLPPGGGPFDVGHHGQAQQARPRDDFYRLRGMLSISSTLAGAGAASGKLSAVPCGTLSS